MVDPIERLIELRRLLEVAKYSNLQCGPVGSWLEGFPNSCCFNVVTLAARFLHEGHGIAKHRIRGAMNAHAPNGAHSWLLVDDLICDLTAHQFPQFLEPIIGARVSKLHEEIFGDPTIWEYEKAAAVCSEWEKESLLPVLKWLYENMQPMLD
jgi:hypothetical protein